MRFASAARVYLSDASRSTITTARAAILACITRHRPAWLIYPVFDKPMSQVGFRTSPLVFPYCRLRPVIVSIACAEVVVNSRINGYEYAALTIFTRSCAVDTLSLDNPVESTKCELFICS